MYFCPNCGNRITDPNTKFCGKCGHKIDSEKLLEGLAKDAGIDINSLKSDSSESKTNNTGGSTEDIPNQVNKNTSGYTENNTADKQSTAEKQNTAVPENQNDYQNRNLNNNQNRNSNNYQNSNQNNYQNNNQNKPHNEMYARHGFEFSDETLKEYYEENMSEYDPDTNDQATVAGRFNSTEKYNKKKLEKRREKLS